MIFFINFIIQYFIKSYISLLGTVPYKIRPFKTRFAQNLLFVLNPKSKNIPFVYISIWYAKFYKLFVYFREFTYQMIIMHFGMYISIFSAKINTFFTYQTLYFQFGMYSTMKLHFL